MKALALLLLCGFFSISCGWGQRVRGGYVRDYHGGGGLGAGEFFYFNAGRFLFYDETDTGTSYGSGTFQRQGDSLMLHFDNWQAPSVVSADLSFRVASRTDSLTIRVLDAVTLETMPGVTVVSDTLPGSATHTSIDGLVQLPAAMLQAGKLRFSFVDYQTAHVKIPLEEGHHFLVRLRPWGGPVAGNTRWSFLIKREASHYTLEDYKKITSQQTRSCLARYKRIEGRYRRWLQ